MRSSKGLGILMGLAAMCTMPARQSPAVEEKVVPNKSGSKIKRYGQAIRLEYPESYSNQQRGFTPAGSARLHFQHTNSFSSGPYQPGYIKAKHRISMAA